MKTRDEERGFRGHQNGNSTCRLAHFFGDHKICLVGDSMELPDLLLEDVVLDEEAALVVGGRRDVDAAEGRYGAHVVGDAAGADRHVGAVQRQHLLKRLHKGHVPGMR